MNSNEKIPIWRDERILKIILQVAIVLIVLTVFIVLGSNLSRNIQRLRLNIDFTFLFDRDRPASFKIGDAPIPYSTTDPFYRALLVGLLNSLRVMVSGIVLATILGITVGIARLSNNWLVRQIATVYVELIRNTPLLLQLFFWYFAVFLRLPKIDNPSIFLNSIFLTNQGLYIPFPTATLQTWLTIAFLACSVIFGIIVWRRQMQIGLVIIAIAAILAIIFGFNWQQPQLDAANQTITGGLSLSPEFAALLVGLTVYTAAFIAEVVRAGIQSVDRGQWEAAKALGLKPNLVMRLVVFPQALRVMIPPLTSEFLNLAKNSSLAIAIGYSDIYAVSSTISNNTGNALEMLVVVMATYLIFNLIVASLMNGLNRAVQIKER